MKWTREAEGYRSGRYYIQRHEVDDREFDGGERWTYWNLIIDDYPVEQHRYLSDAKADAERVEAKRNDPERVLRVTATEQAEGIRRSLERGE